MASYVVVPLKLTKPTSGHTFDRLDVAASLAAMLQPGDRVVSVYPVRGLVRNQWDPAATYFELEALVERKEPASHEET